MAKVYAAHLEQVTHRFGSHVALRGIDLAVEPGEVVALLGPNGAGKTTAIKLLLGLLAPGAGTAQVFGQNPRMNKARERIGAMLQVARVPETLSAANYLDLFRSYYPHPLATAEVLEIAGLRGIEHKVFRDLSGGQRQRLLFGLAICGDPDLLFLDEPTLGMDIETRQALWAQVRSLSSRGKAVLLTTHYLEEADSLADRIVVIDQGVVIASGTPAEIKGRVQGRRIRCVTEISTETIRVLPTVRDVELRGAATLITCDDAEGVLRHLLAADPMLSGLEVTSPALEDAFLALTGGHRNAPGDAA